MINHGLHSWNDFVARAESHDEVPGLPGADTWSGAIGVSPEKPSWYGTSTFKEAVLLAKNGWSDGVKQISVALDSLPPDSVGSPDWQLDVMGSMCNVPAFISGEPECMWNRSSESRSEKRITLAVNGTYGSATTASSALNYAVGIAAVVRMLEANGIDVAVYNIEKIASNDINMLGVVVKEFGEPLDLSKVAFAFHPSWLRRISFAWKEMTQAAVAGGIASNGYGASKTFDSVEAVELIGHDIGNLIIPTAVKNMRNQLDTYGSAVVALQSEIRAAIAKMQ